LWGIEEQKAILGCPVHPEHRESREIPVDVTIAKEVVNKIGIGYFF
jgi:hypothetical protein